jgi:mono/diheme cytochrome c family protein
MRKNKVLVALSLAALAAFGCSNVPDEQAGTTGGSTSAPSTPIAAPTTAAPVAVSTPTVEAAPDLEYDNAKAQPGFADVKKLKNPFAGDQEATKKGAELFQTNCASCHGATGVGDGPAGMALTPKPRNLTAFADYKYGKGDLGIFRSIKHGIDGGGMTGWADRMTDDESWQVVNYVRTLQK